MRLLDNMTEPELSELMTRCALAIQRTAELMDIEKPMFVLLLFNDSKVGQYISNCERQGIIDALRQTANRLEKRQDVTR